jgi:DNA (cytosine-5)-methyltransferase 1
MNVDHSQELTHLSLCTGYGGIDIGLSRALSGAVRSVAYVEIEAFAVSNLVSKIENGHLDTAPIYTDLKRFPWRRFRGRVDILSGGFPCQPFSAAGRRAGDEDPRHLFPYILGGLRELGRPPLVFLENVEGIISSKLKGVGWSDPEATPVLLHVLRELERVGYDATAGVFSAREIGAPHQRKRVFIMACRADLGDSGRALVSGMLERGREQDVGNPHARGCESSERRSAERSSGSEQITESGTAYPAPRGAEQHAWEPPRVTVGDAASSRPQRGKQARAPSTPTIQSLAADADGGLDNADEPRLQGPLPPMDTREPRSSNARPVARSGAHGHIQGQAQPAMGGDADGPSRRVDYAELCYAVDNRTDELRLLGNGVVPDTAARAFRELWRDLIERG